MAGLALEAIFDGIKRLNISSQIVAVAKMRLIYNIDIRKCPGCDKVHLGADVSSAGVPMSTMLPENPSCC